MEARAAADSQADAGQLDAIDVNAGRVAMACSVDTVFCSAVEGLICLQEKQCEVAGFYVAPQQGAGSIAHQTLRKWLRPTAVRLIAHCGGGGFKSQFKKADKSGARYAIVLGEDELGRGVAGVKPLRSGEQQQDIPLDQIAAFLAAAE